METWMIWALASVFVGGLYHFINKVTAERNYNTNVVNCICYIVGTILMGGIILVQGNYDMTKGVFLFIALMGFLNATLYSISIITRVEAMKNIDTVIFYPIYKVFGPIFVTCISIFFFGESLNYKEVLGIIVGICVPLLLITRKENTIQKNLFLGLILIVVTAILSAISSSTPKVIQVENLDIDMFLFMTFVFGMFFSYLLYKGEKKFRLSKKRVYNKEGIIKFGIIAGIFNTAAFYSFTKALEGNLAIVFTINSFAILIPIILSIIFYGEHFNLKKGIVILLSIVSILLFI